MRMPAPGGRPRTSSMASPATVGFERGAESGERALVRTRFERRLELGAHHAARRHRQGHGCRGRADQRHGDDRRRPEHAACIGERQLDGAAARDRPAVGDGDADEPCDRGDEEGEAGLDRECGVHDAERDAGEQQHRRRDDGGGRPPAAQGDGHGRGRRHQREEERRHQQGLVGADRHRDRHELLPRQGGAREEFDDALGRGDDADDGPARHGGGDAQHEVGAEHGDHDGPCGPPELRAGHRDGRARDDGGARRHHEGGALVDRPPRDHRGHEHGHDEEHADERGPQPVHACRASRAAHAMDADLARIARRSSRYPMPSTVRPATVRTAAPPSGAHCTATASTPAGQPRGRRPQRCDAAPRSGDEERERDAGQSLGGGARDIREHDGLVVALDDAEGVEQPIAGDRRQFSHAAPADGCRRCGRDRDPRPRTTRCGRRGWPVPRRMPRRSPRARTPRRRRTPRGPGRAAP